MKILSSLTFQQRHREILLLVKDQKMRLVLAMLCMLVMASTDLAQAWVVRPLFDDIFVNKNQWMLNLLPAVVIIIYFLRSIAYYGENYFMEYVGQPVV